MKKTLIVALAIVAGAIFSTASADKKKKKEKPMPMAECCKAEAKTPVNLLNGSDTLSYVAGIKLTEGLKGYLLNQMKIDTAYMDTFIEGFNHAVANAKNAKEAARMAGMTIADQVLQRMLPSVQQEFSNTPDTIVEALLFRGFTDAISGDASVFSEQDAQQLFTKKQQLNKEVKKARATESGRKFLAENKKREGVITTDSGLQYEVLKKGDGLVPQKTDKVRVHYEGRLIDGTVFDASTKHGSEPATFRPDQVIKGWTEALTMMPVGSKWRLYIPQELAYGERQAGQIPPYSTLIFDVELISIDK